MRDIDALDNLYPRLILPAVSAALVFSLVAMTFASTAPALTWLPVLLIVLALLVLPLLGWHAGRTLLPEQVRGRATLRTHLLDCSEGLEDFSLHADAWTRQRGDTLARSAHWLAVQGRSRRRAAILRAATAIAVGLCAWGALGLLAGLPAGSRPEAPGWRRSSFFCSRAARRCSRWSMPRSTCRERRRRATHRSDRRPVTRAALRHQGTNATRRQHRDTRAEIRLGQQHAGLQRLRCRRSLSTRCDSFS